MNTTTDTTDDIAVTGIRASIGRNWKLITALVVIGAALTTAVAQLTATGFRAEGHVYLGKQLGLTGEPLGTIESQLNTALAYTDSDPVIAVAEEKSGIDGVEIRDNLNVRPIESPIATQLGGQIQVIEISVTLPDKQDARKVLWAIGNEIVRAQNEFLGPKASFLEERNENLDTYIESQEELITTTSQSLQAVDGSSPAAAVLTSVLQNAAQERFDARQEQYLAREQLRAYEQVELGRWLKEPTAREVTAAPWFATAATGGALGLIIGLLVVLTRPHPASRTK